MAGAGIPKVMVHVQEDFNLHWNCPGCGEHNVIWMPECFSIEDIKAEVAKMSDQLDEVKCQECCRKFVRADP